MTGQERIHIGLDVGSTTVKVVALDGVGDVVFNEYRRHMSDVRGAARDILTSLAERFADAPWNLCMTGSGAIAMAEELRVGFVQELIASELAIAARVPDADVVIELGGEDAKLTFLTGGVEQRMNETCAGGTGAFIDQMAAFVQTDAAGLDALAQRHTILYPIASRCGVFAKTDVLPLLNEGCAKEDIAASIMQAVVDQTVSGLARGRAIKGRVVFLGGPLAFLASLRDRFVATLKLLPQDAVFPEHAEYFVAYGAALHAREGNAETRTLADLAALLARPGEGNSRRLLPPLFTDVAEREAFHQRHAGDRVERLPLAEAEGGAWLGIDSGSTTIKAALIDAQGRLLYSFYGPNQGDPLAAAVRILNEIYAAKKSTLEIRAAAATGYGSGLLTAGLGMDIDEVETVAHFTAARHFQPDVTFVLDIGGQDIKCMNIRDGAVSRIQLNEACSAGCGSFIENFSQSLEMPLDTFVEAALNARAPVDLGTRCTVFMNSMVKQAQKEGVDVGDIAAGLSYAVIRNACYKVMKFRDPSELGDRVVAQGGAFKNDALLRALERELGQPVTRPDIAGLMGAFGAALIARERGGTATRLATPEALAAFNPKSTTTRCKRCTNKCLLTVTDFGNGRRFISGNRCERGAEAPPADVPNLYAYKLRRLFDPYVPLEKSAAPRGTVGIPRALNIFENYPLWFTLLTRLGFRVELSAPSSKDLYTAGYETIPSQTVCYPAKLAHGHLIDLINRGVDAIFYPCLPHEQPECPAQHANFNCPVVIGYPELLARNVNALRDSAIPYHHPFLPLDKKNLPRRLARVPLFAGIPLRQLRAATRAAFAEMDRFKRDIRDAGQRAIARLAATNTLGIILSGHPYHIDPEVHHGIPDLITSCGLAVLTEDSVAHLHPTPFPLRVVNQWTYHGRLYRAGAYAATTDNLALLQLISFGCGLDSITSDQLEEILIRNGRLYAQIKIDEGANLGPARIRIRSLLAALRQRLQQKAEHRARNSDGRSHEQLSPSSTSPLVTPCSVLCPHSPPLFTEEMRRTHTILIPQMSPVHFQFMEAVFARQGYRVEQLPSVDKAAVDLGLRYVNNDACYPAIVVIGQLLQAVHTRRHDAHRLALLISQTGGGCRATNYIAYLRKALHDCRLPHIPILSFNLHGAEKHPGFHLTAPLLHRVIMSVLFGDALMRMTHRLRPYEAEPGATEALAAHWSAIGNRCIASGNPLRFDRAIFAMIRAFDKLPLRDIPRKPRVGVVGEILLKYHPDANNHAVSTIESEGGEAVVTDLMDFALYCLHDPVFNHRHLTGSWFQSLTGRLGILYLELLRWSVILGFRLSKRFTPPLRFRRLRAKARGLVSCGHQAGEGWLLAAEMVELLDSGATNILCLQPFGCLPNHITGKGLLKELKIRHPSANIIALDYDPGASETNQINRIKLLMSIARKHGTHP